MQGKKSIRELIRVTGYRSPDLEYLLTCMDLADLKGIPDSNEEDDVYSDVRISRY